MAVEGAVGRWWRVVGYDWRGGGRVRVRVQGLRLLASKAANRAAVHGLKHPLKDTISTNEEIEKEIEKAKEEKLKKRREVEEAVNSQSQPKTSQE